MLPCCLCKLLVSLLSWAEQTSCLQDMFMLPLSEVHHLQTVLYLVPFLVLAIFPCLFAATAFCAGFFLFLNSDFCAIFLDFERCVNLRLAVYICRRDAQSHAGAQPALNLTGLLGALLGQTPCPNLTLNPKP